jgi:nicotinate-nucleotide pyrophosphorylase (carboxylating)
VNPGILDDFLRRVIDEDVGAGDVTTDAIVPTTARARGVVRMKAPGVICGLDVAARIFHLIDPDCRWQAGRRDGDWIEPVPEDVAEVSGPARSLLMGERVALNLMQRLSAVATAARRAVLAAEGRCVVLDTRKTTPGLRLLEKYAVRVGGATNHRHGLADGVLIKDNHIRVAGSVTEAVRRARAAVPPVLKIEVEATTLGEVVEALEAGADMILLDNMSPEEMRQSVDRIGGRVPTEASGGITLENLSRIADAGVTYASMGSLTHSVRALDISLKIVAVER